MTQRFHDGDAAGGDVELIRRIGSRDAAAVGEFYDRHAGLLFSVALKIVRDPAEAEDVLQEAFEQIWQRATQFDDTLGQPVHWAVTIVRNRAIDHLRASIRRARLTDEATQGADSGTSEGSANEALYGREQAAQIHAAVRGLPEEQRRAIELAFFSGLTQTEISEQLREPLGTVKSRIRRGLTRLRDALEALAR